MCLCRYKLRNEVFASLDAVIEHCTKAARLAPSAVLHDVNFEQALNQEVYEGFDA